MDDTIVNYFIWFIGCIFSSVITAISGGGGMISIPLLIYLGLPSHFILGINKVILTTASVTATWRYYKNGLLQLNQELLLSFVLCIGMAVFGAEMSDVLSTYYMLILLLVMIILLFLMDWLTKKRNQDNEKNKAHLRPKIIYPTAIVIGFYSGFFGPGTSVISFFIISFFASVPTMINVAFSKSLAMISSLAALITFAVEGKVLWDYGLIGLVGAFKGSWIGAGLAMKVDPKKVKLFFNVMLVVFLMKTLYDLFIES
ncbi:sulfite exporter TauE/SafE family protein [Flammeovirga pacifica]|nr:sulfite exporter TauE/SafE family protein [Flammeovirga pacifica]